MSTKTKHPVKAAATKKSKYADETPAQRDKRLGPARKIIKTTPNPDKHTRAVTLECGHVRNVLLTPRRVVRCRRCKTGGPVPGYLGVSKSKKQPVPATTAKKRPTPKKAVKKATTQKKTAPKPKSPVPSAPSAPVTETTQAA